MRRGVHPGSCVERYRAGVRVGVYVDGYNLYYGGRQLCGRGTPGWRWLDIRALATDLIAAQTGWPDATIEKVIYCTARVGAGNSPQSAADQDAYLKALTASSTVDHIEYGHYTARTRKGLLATEDNKHRPQIHTADWPVKIQDADGNPVPDARSMAQFLFFEEKGSDVNVATHLTLDVIGGNIDAAVVISNDSDLRLPVVTAREIVPVGLVNPRGGIIAGDLAGKKTDGVGNHWFRKLGADDFLIHQLPAEIAGYHRPTGW